MRHGRESIVSELVGYPHLVVAYSQRTTVRFARPPMQAITCRYCQHVLNIQQGALGDGLGARVWALTHTAARLLVANQALLETCDILELGSGCGVVGILAAKLGA